MKKIYIITLSMSIGTLLTGCPATPNEVNISLTQGACVQPSMYRVTPPSTIVNNPSSAPYCMGVAIQNNNKGLNANNIQIIASGLNINYRVGNTTFSGILYDPVAAQTTIRNANQSYGNVAIYDPRNCVTSQGANVITLNSGGGSCTFYLQLTGESHPIGTYATSFTYNYSNGNQNFSITRSINQRVYLYGAASSGLYFVSKNLPAAANESVEWQALNQLSALPINVPYILNGALGYLYYVSANQVYAYDGNSSSQIGNNLPSNVVSIAFDKNANIYAGTQNGIYVNRKATSSSWERLEDYNKNITESTNVIGLRGYEFINSKPNQLYAITPTTAYICVDPEITSSNVRCRWNQLNTGGSVPTKFFTNAIDIDDSGGLYIGSTLSAYKYQPSEWLPPYIIDPQITGNFYAVRWAPTSPAATLYLGEAGANNNESAIYSCNLFGKQCSPLYSRTNNTVSGDIYGVTTDGPGNVYIGGTSLKSPDFESTVIGYTAGYLLRGSESASIWRPIRNGELLSAPVRYVTVSSMLTN